jgi:predicted nucleotidyltransferase
MATGHAIPYDHEELPPADYVDPVIEAYKKDVDRTLLREMLKLTPQQRSLKFEGFMALAHELRTSAARRYGRSDPVRTRFGDVLRVLNANCVKFVIVSGIAGLAHGLARATFDIDLLYRRDTTNIRRLVEALLPFNPRLRGAPAGFRFSWDEQTVEAGLNFPLVTTLGDIDLLGEVTGVGSHEQLLPDCITMVVFGQRCHCVTLERLIQIKRAAGRPKDFEMIAQMQALLEERRKREMPQN